MFAVIEISVCCTTFKICYLPTLESSTAGPFSRTQMTSSIWPPGLTLGYTVPCVLSWFPGKVPPSKTTHSRRTHTKPSPRRDPRGVVNIKNRKKINVLVESFERDSMISYLISFLESLLVGPRRHSSVIR